MGILRDLCARLLVGLCSLAASAAPFAQTPVVSDENIGPTIEEAGTTDPFPSPYFGEVLAIHGRTAMASIPGDIAVGDNVFGRVGVYTKSDDEWHRTATLIGEEESGGAFGQGIDIDDDAAVIASAKALYLFARHGSTWRQSAKVVLRAAGRFFGGSVEMDHGLIAAHVHEDRGDLGNENIVHIYARRGQTLQRVAVLRSRDGLPNSSFGTSLAFEDHVLVAGSPGGELAPGVAYVYLNIGRFLIPIDRLLASDAAPADGFGASVATRNGIIVVGAPGADLGIDDESYGWLRGNVYVFAPSRRGWYEIQKLNDGTEPDPLPGIGGDVALGHDMLAIKADDITSTIRGEDRVFVYDRVNRIFQQRQQVARFEGSIPDIDMSGRRLILSKHVTPVFIYYVTGSATIYTFGKANEPR